MPTVTFHFISPHSFFVAKVQILLSAILTGVFSTIGSTFIEARTNLTARAAA